MKKIVEILEKNDNKIVFLIIFLSVIGIAGNIWFFAGDDLWNFQNIYKMYNGFQIYKECNVIITPLFFLIGKVLFYIIEPNILSFRIYNILIDVILFFITYLLLKKIKIKKVFAFIVTMILMLLGNYSIIRVGANYNVLALCIYIIGIYILLNKKNSDKPIIQGIIGFLIFLTKQNIGIFYMLGLIIYNIFSDVKIKKKIKNIIIESSVFLGNLIIFAGILYKNNILYDFINYCFLGMKEFASENVSIQVAYLIIMAFFTIINIILANIFIKNKKIKMEESEKRKIKILCSFAMLMQLAIFPIMNEIHFIIGEYINIILFIYFCTFIIKKSEIQIKNKNIKKVKNIFLIVIVCFTIYNSLNCLYAWVYRMNDNYKIAKEDPFYGAIIQEDLLNKIENIKKYKKENNNNVIILSSEAGLYRIDLKENNGVFDLPFKGNLGKDGEVGLINQIPKNKKILIEKDEEDLDWQESKIVRDYIIENCEYIEEIENFLVYEQK